MPSKFRKTIWLKRRDFILCEPILEGDKVKYEIVKILQPDHIKSLSKQGLFPFELKTGGGGDATESKRKVSGSENSGSESDDDIPANPNRREYVYSEDSDTSEESGSEDDAENIPELE